MFSGLLGTPAAFESHAANDFQVMVMIWVVVLVVVVVHVPQSGAAVRPERLATCLPRAPDPIQW